MALDNTVLDKNVVAIGGVEDAGVCRAIWLYLGEGVLNALDGGVGAANRDVAIGGKPSVAVYLVCKGVNVTALDGYRLFLCGDGKAFCDGWVIPNNGGRGVDASVRVDDKYLGLV